MTDTPPHALPHLPLGGGLSLGPIGPVFVGGRCGGRVRGEQGGEGEAGGERRGGEARALLPVTQHHLNSSRGREGRKKDGQCLLAERRWGGMAEDGGRQAGKGGERKGSMKVGQYSPASSHRRPRAGRAARRHGPTTTPPHLLPMAFGCPTAMDPRTNSLWLLINQRLCLPWPARRRRRAGRAARRRGRAGAAPGSTASTATGGASP